MGKRHNTTALDPAEADLSDVLPDGIPYDGPRGSIPWGKFPNRVADVRPVECGLADGSEFAGRVLEAWAMEHGVQLIFIRTGRPMENGFIESFNGR